MNTMTPIITVVPVAVAEWLEQATADAWQRLTTDIPADEVKAITESLAANGWTIEQYVAGGVVSGAYELQTGRDAWAEE